ncbi:carbonic anhydrase [Pyxidicoccus trucidator]|uniref:carbonic anhydrase n=1 Tax=Pyxidicoccus trucidator TaxID=2709662 RepID=UPI0013DBD874|nr:carbonic anhydrase [Pyxidicoccus trucidator]
MSDENAFVSRVPYEHTHPTVLAIYCSDGRFTDAVEDLAQHLGHERIDTLTIPGGPALLNRWVADYLESDVITRAARFLIEGHHITEVLLLAHAGCGYYQTRHGALGPEFVAEQQLTDLRHAAEELQKAHPRMAVRLFFTRPHGERIHFEPVSLKP